MYHDFECFNYEDNKYPDWVKKKKILTAAGTTTGRHLFRSDVGAESNSQDL